MSARWNGSLRRARRPSGSLSPAGPAATRGTISTGGRLNAVQELAGFLLELGSETLFEMTAFSGGSAHNAIPGEAAVTLVFPAGREEFLRARARTLEGEIARWHGESDPRVRVTVVEPLPRPERVWSGRTVLSVCTLLTGLFHGVYAMHPDFPGVVGASANVAAVRPVGDMVQVLAFLRCARQEEELALSAQHDGAAEQTGFRLEEVSRYPGWPGDPESPLVHLLCESFRAAAGREMEVTAVHVGLEPSVLGEKAPGMTMVSTGADILDAHSVDERAPLAGLPEYAATLAGVLAGRKGISR